MNFKWPKESFWEWVNPMLTSFVYNAIMFYLGFNLVYIFPLSVVAGVTHTRESLLKSQGLLLLVSATMSALAM